MKILGLLISAALLVSVLAAPMTAATTTPVSSAVVVLDEAADTESEVTLLEGAAYTEEPRVATLTETGSSASLTGLVLIGLAVAGATYLGGYLRHLVR